ncbi:MAG: Acyl carrier protein, mitochondrial [Trichoglossum hirsutum]|nr:MAG: Acyl carrier protein, mitochondrial [Trichoglossum hirsutum]
MRIALVRSARSLIQRPLQQRCVIARLATFNATSNIARSTHFAPALSSSAVRFYSAPAGLTQEQVEGRILDLLKNFDKVNDPSKLSPNSHFANDLGLDSLDTVEVVMAIEEEFSLEIPDKEADAIHSVDKAVQYILSQPDAH